MLVYFSREKEFAVGEWLGKKTYGAEIAAFKIPAPQGAHVLRRS
jgi:hypothetical protein